MLQGILIKKIMDIVMKQLLKQFNLDKIQKYVEQPNELDKQVKAIQKNVSKYGKYIEDIEKDIAIIKDVVGKSDSIKKQFDKLKKPRF